MSDNLPVFRRKEIYNAKPLVEQSIESQLQEGLPPDDPKGAPFIQDLPIGMDAPAKLSADAMPESISSHEPHAPLLFEDEALQGEIESVPQADGMNRHWIDADLMDDVEEDEEVPALNLETHDPHPHEPEWETFELNTPVEEQEESLVQEEQEEQEALLPTPVIPISSHEPIYQADAAPVSAILPPQPQAETDMPYETADESAFELAAKFLETYRNNPKSDTGAEALYWAAENYQKAGLPGKARGLYQDFMRNFPNHPKVSAAQQALQWMDVDMPSEDQLMSRPTLNDKLADKPESNPTVSAAVASGMTAQIPYANPVPESAVKGGATRRIETVPTAEEQAVFMAKKKEDEDKPMLIKIASNYQNQTSERKIGIGLAVICAVLLIFFLIYVGRSMGSNSGNLQSLAQRQGSNVITSPPVTSTTPSTAPTTPSTQPSTSDPNASTSVPPPSEAPLLAGGDLVASEGGWGWQFKYATSRTELETMATALRARGYRAGIIPGPPEAGTGQPGFRLVVGQFRAKDDAKLNRDKLPTDAPSDVWVVEIK
jgi:cell division septation protein DedD